MEGAAYSFANHSLSKRETQNRQEEVFYQTCPGTYGLNICCCVSLSCIFFFFFLIYFGLKFSPSSSGIHISLHLHPRIFIVHTSSSQIKEMIHTSPPACEPTTYLDSFLTKVNRIFMSRFRRAYMVQPVFDNHIPGKIISARRARSSKIQWLDSAPRT